MNYSDIAVLILMAKRWDQIDPAEMVDFTTLEPVAMSGTITRAADDVATIGARLKEIEAERAAARRQSDPEHATGEDLDRVAGDWGEKRAWGGEADYTFRARLLKKIRGE